MGNFEFIANLGSGWVFVIDLVCIVLGGLLATRIIVAVARHFLRKSKHVDNAITTFIVNVIKVTCLIVIVAMALQVCGVPTSTIVEVVGAAGAAIALALRDSLANVAGGFMIIITQPFGKGDLVQIGEYRGRVQEIDLFLTVIRTLDYKTITVPNGLINTSVIVNESNQDMRRVDCNFSVSYDSNVPEAMRIMSAVCDSNPAIKNSPAPVIGVKELADSGVIIELLAYCNTEDYFDVKYYLYETVKIAFQEHNIEIPYPHIDVKVKK